MADYSANVAIGAMTTLDRALLNADGAAIVEGAAMRAATLRTGTRFRAADLEHPEHLVIPMGEYCGHKGVDWWTSGGAGRSIVFEDPAPEFTRDSEGQPSGLYLAVESQGVVNTIGCFLVPQWGAADAATPKLRIRRLAVSVVVAVNDATLEDSAASDAKQFENDADVAGALTVRVHRIKYDKLRPRGIEQAPIPRAAAGTRVDLTAADFVSDKIEATLIATLTGMVAGPRVRSEIGTIATSGIHPNWDGSDGGETIASSVAFRLFHCHALLGAGSFAAKQNLAPGDAVLVSITGSDRLINAGEAAFNEDKRNTILPVRGHWVVPVFSGEHAA